jgi:hypothetical protein
VLPGFALREVLVEQVPFVVEIDQTIGVVHPTGGRRKVIGHRPNYTQS